MQSLQSLVWLDGHGAYVWGSVLMCALVAALEVAWLRYRRRAALAALPEATASAHLARPPRVTTVRVRAPSAPAHPGDAA